jgi:tyrosine-protein phosphatase SIW14
MKNKYLSLHILIFLATVLAVLLLYLTGKSASAETAGLGSFSTDGCSLFPDGEIRDRTKWCDCCLSHDIAYWQGGTEADRVKADETLRDCVLARTNDKVLAETMYLGVRAGGHPAFLTWYRWGYGWPYGRGYSPLSDVEKAQVRQLLEEYARKHPSGYCEGQDLKTSSSAAAQRRPEKWATPVKSEYLKNFFKLDKKVYRSAQPNSRGFRELKRLGIRNVLSFRDYHSDDGKDSGLNLYRVEMEAGDIKTEKVIEALRIIMKAEGPVLIHCWHGSDRTGLISAMYRIVFQGWSKDDAIDELMHGGYGYHPIYKNIPEFIRQADIGEIRAAVMNVATAAGRSGAGIH